MPEHLRALVVILVLAGAVFAAARPLACAVAMTERDFCRRRNLWFALTLVAFLAHNFWIFIAFAAALLLLAALAEGNKLALYFFVLLAVPAIDAEIPGFGLVEHFFAIDHVRLLALVVLLPAWLALRMRPDAEPFGRSSADKLLARLPGAAALPAVSARHAHRGAAQRRVLRLHRRFPALLRGEPRGARPRGLREALMAFAVGALAAAAIAVFEFGRHWLLYTPLEEALGVDWGLLNYLERGDGILRAQASTGQPIVLGYVLAVALGVDALPAAIHSRHAHGAMPRSRCSRAGWLPPCRAGRGSAPRSCCWCSSPPGRGRCRAWRSSAWPAPAWCRC